MVWELSRLLHPAFLLLSNLCAGERERGGGRERGRERKRKRPFMALLLRSKPHGQESMADPHLSLNPHLGSSSVTPFPTPPTTHYTCQPSLIFCLSLATIVSPGRRGLVTEGNLLLALLQVQQPGNHFPCTSWVKVMPGSEHSRQII